MRAALLMLLLAALASATQPPPLRWPALPMRSRAASASVAGASWQVLTNTYLAAGSDLTNGSLTVEAAEAQCAADARCLGFTYNGATSPGPAYDMLLKTTIATGSGEGWVTYIKELPRVLTGSFSNSAVLQHDAPCLSGYGSNVTGAAVAVSTDADGNAAHATTVGADNTWRLCLPPMAPGGPWTVNVSVAGFGGVTLTDILFGEVWLASG